MTYHGRVGTLRAAEQSANKLHLQPKPQHPPARIRLRGWVATVVSIACIALVVANTDLAELRVAAHETDYGLLGLAMSISGLTVIAKAMRWRLLYPTWVRPSMALAIAGVAVGQVANWAVPFRAGEAIRVGLAGSMAAADGRGVGRVVAISVGVLAIEKVLDGCLLLLTVAALVVLVGVPGWLSSTALVVALAGCTIGLIVAVGLRPRRDGSWSANAHAWIERWVPTRVRAWLDYAGGVGEGLSAWLSRAAAVRAMAWTIGAWVLGGVANFVVVKSVAIDLREALPATLSVLAALYGAAVVPTLPGRLGVFQYLCIAALMPFGVVFNQALAFALGLYLVVYTPPIAIGLISALFVGRAAWPGLSDNE